MVAGSACGERGCDHLGYDRNFSMNDIYEVSERGDNKRVLSMKDDSLRCTVGYGSATDEGRSPLLYTVDAPGNMFLCFSFSFFDTGGTCAPDRCV